jgi:ABC-type nitrate/sulfonate/bicarbonate transport system ATPase subunit
MTLLELCDVSFSYHVGGGMGVRNISFTISAGETVAIVGRSGVGKSTVLKLVADQLRPSAGSIVRAPLLLEFGALSYLDQQATVFPWYRLEQIFRIALAKSRHSVAAPSAAAISEALHSFGLAGGASLYAAQLSGGMKQRAALAFALLKAPSLLLLDEPFAALDDQTRSDLHSVLERHLEKEKSGVLLVSHSIDEALFLANRIIMLEGHPAEKKEEFVLGTPRPRSSEFLFSEEFLSIKRQILKRMCGG